jgi:hypothetical protein
MYPSRKRNNYFKRKQSRKIRGGQAAKQEQLAEEIQGEHPGLVGPAVNLVSSTANNVASAAITGASNLLGVNLASTDSVNNALEKEIKVLSDPETKEHIQEVIGEGAQVLATGLEAAQPAINQLVETTTEAVEKSAEKIGNAGINIALNTLEEIPMLGVLVGTIRSVDKAIAAGQSVVNAGSEIITAEGDAINQITQNIEDATKKFAPKVPELPSTDDLTKSVLSKLPEVPKMPDVKGDLTKKMTDKVKEKTQILNKVGGSIAEFHDSTLNPEKFLSQYGGKSRRYRKHNSKNRLSKRRYR